MKKIVALLIIVESFILTISCTHYITPLAGTAEHEAEEVFLLWSTIQCNISRYFTSHTVMCFWPGEYKNITVTDIVNCTIIGIVNVTFKCSSNAAVFVNASKDVSIHNMKFENCGVKIICTINNDLFYVFTTTFGLFNVQPIVLSNITFENSLGHGIVGINVLGSSTLVNITVYHNNNLSGNSLTPISGIILVYVDTIDDDVHHNQTQSEKKVLINNCTICCMSDQSSDST